MRLGTLRLLARRPTTAHGPQDVRVSFAAISTPRHPLQRWDPLPRLGTPVRRHAGFAVEIFDFGAVVDAYSSSPTALRASAGSAYISIRACLPSRRVYTCASSMSTGIPVDLA